MTDSDWIAVGSVAGAFTAIGTVVMAVAIVVTAVVASRTLNATRQDSRDRTRPVIVAEFRRELLSQGTTLLVVKNLGRSVATNVSLQFDPPPPDDVAALPDENMMKWLYERYATPISSWAPGWTVSNVVRAGHEELDPLKVTANYEGPDGTKYADSYDLHPDHILKETSVGPSKTTDPTKLEQQKLSALHALVRTLRSF